MEHICHGLKCIHEWNLTDEMMDMGLPFYIMGKIPFLYQHNNKIVEMHLTNTDFGINRLQKA